MQRCIWPHLVEDGVLAPRGPPLPNPLVVGGRVEMRRLNGFNPWRQVRLSGDTPTITVSTHEQSLHAGIG